MRSSISQFLRGVRIRALIFGITFVGSVLLTAVMPSVKDQVRWHAQHELCRAAAHGDVRRMKFLLFLGAHADGLNITYRPILFAARNGQSEAIELLLSEGADINSIGTWRQTPLVEAIWGKHQDTARRLLSRGAKPCFQNDGWALWNATMTNQVEMVALLMRNGAGDCSDAESALSLAVENSQSDLVRELLVGGVDPVGVSATSQVLPLTRVAAMNGDKKTMKLLKAAGAK